MRTLCLSLLLSTPLAMAAPVPLQVCVDKNDWVPFTLGERDGELQTRLRTLAPQHGFAVQISALPWARCLAEVESGKYHALLAVGANHYATARYAFPMRQGVVDGSRAMARSELVFIRLSGSALEWDGKTLRGLNGPVLFVHGYREVQEALQQAGLPADGGATTNEQNALKLLAGRGNAIATFIGDAKAMLQNPGLQSKFEMMSPAFALSAYYLAFHPAFYRQHQAQVEALWTAAAAPRQVN